MSSYLEGIIILVGINIIAVLGVSVLTGFTRLFSFGNAGFMAVGAYTSAILTTKYHTPFIISIFGGMLVAALISIALGKLTLGLKGDYFLITTLGFGECVRVLIEFLDPITGGARGYAGIPQKTNLTVVVVAVIICVIITRNLITSKYGRNIMAIREQELAAEAVGINTAHFKLLSFMVSAVFAGLAGALFAHYYMFITPGMFNLDKSAELTITVVIGGLGSITGSIIATTVLTLLPEILRAVADYRMLLYGISVVLIIILRPNGLMGYKEFSIESLKKIKNFIMRKRKEVMAR